MDEDNIVVSQTQRRSAEAEHEKAQLDHAGQFECPSKLLDATCGSPDLRTIEKRGRQDRKIKGEPHETTVSENLEVDAVRGMRRLIWEIVVEDDGELRSRDTVAEGKMLACIAPGNFPGDNAPMEGGVVFSSLNSVLVR